MENRGNYAVFILIGPNRPLVIFLPFPLIGCPVEESLLLSTGLLFSRSTLDLLERGCSENVLGKFFLPFQSNAAGGNLKILRKVLKGENNLIIIIFLVSDPIIVNNK